MRPVTLCAVTITVSETICFLALVFFICIFFQWMRDTKAKTASPPVAENEGGETWDRKRSYFAGSRRAAERNDRTTVTSPQVTRIKEESRGHET